jgi:hypothetical protein
MGLVIETIVNYNKGIPAVIRQVFNREGIGLYVLRDEFGNIASTLIVPDWQDADLGRPEQITVTIAAGDRLNVFDNKVLTPSEVRDIMTQAA